MSTLLSVATCALGIVCIAIVWKRASSIEDWIESVVDGDKFDSTRMLCSLQFMFNSTEYGSDVGVLFLREGFLHFDGVRTDFALSSRTVDFPEDWRRIVLRYDSRFSLVVTPVRSTRLIDELAHGFRRGAVRIAHPDWIDARQEADMFRSLAYNYEEEVARLPPLVPYPPTVVFARAFRGLMLGTCVSFLACFLCMGLTVVALCNFLSSIGWTIFALCQYKRLEELTSISLEFAERSAASTRNCELT